MAITPNFWSVDGITLDKKSEANFDAHPNGKYNLWLKFDSNGVVNLADSSQYPLDKVFTQAEHSKNVRFFGATPIGGIFPFYLLDFSEPKNSQYLSFL